MAAAPSVVSERDTGGTVSLAELGYEALALFRQVVSPGNPNATKYNVLNEDHRHTILNTSIATEFERFELWAVNLGLFVTGHGSLDYRVREAERLAQTIRRFMRELVESLADVMQLRNAGANKQRSTEGDEEGDARSGSEECSDAEDGDSQESEMDILLDGVRDPIDRLYKVSTKIRNPASRLGSSKALDHKQIDEETGVDLLQVAESFDRNHIRSLFLQYQKEKVMQEDATVEPQLRDNTGVEEEGEGLVLDPTRIGLPNYSQDIYLVQRLSRANMRRRQQFAYWKKHRDKLHRHTRASFSAQSTRNESNSQPQVRPLPDRFISNDSSRLLSPTLPSVTTATNLNVLHVDAAEQRSTFTASEYAPSTWRAARDTVAFPPPPTVQGSDKFFECPYCLTICPTSNLDPKAWKAHLIRDLRPYICTYEDCKNPDQLYDTSHDWNHHESSCHRKIWRCPDHSDLAFTQIETYQQHVRQEHNEYLDADSSNWIIQASESTLTMPDRPCPICWIVLDTSRAMHGHIALHLERIALFSLPRSVGDDIDDADSHQANGTIEGSRDNAFDGDDVLDIRSEEAADEDNGFDSSSRSGGDQGADIPMKLTKEAIEAVTNGVIQREAAQIEGGWTEMPACLAVKGKPINIFEEHNTAVYSVAFSPDNKLLASVSDDKVVRLWDLETYDQTQSFSGHTKGFRSLAWSPNGKIIASGSYDKTTKLWDPTSGRCLHTLRGHLGAVSGLAYTSNSKLVVSASHDKTAKLWEVETGIEIFTLRGHTVGVWSVTISPDDRYIITGSNDRMVKVWDTVTGAVQHTMQGHGRVIYAAAVSPDSRVLATGSNDWTIKLWELESGTLLRTLEGHEKGITALAFSPDGRLLASGAYDHTVRLWETSRWDTVTVLEGHSADVYTVAFSRDGKKLASGSRDRMVRLWELNDYI